MLNLFIASTTFGQEMSCIFDLGVEGTLADKRITALEDCVVHDPIYAKEVSPEKIASLVASGQSNKVTGLIRASEVETIRVNSLAALIRQLEAINTNLNRDDIILAYVPRELLQELESGRIKFYLTGETTTSYYSAQELELWKSAIQLIQSLYTRLVFKDINACKKNISGTPVQTDRVSIYSSMHQKLLDAYRTMKQSKTNGIANGTVDAGPVF